MENKFNEVRKNLMLVQKFEKKLGNEKEKQESRMILNQFKSLNVNNVREGAATADTDKAADDNPLAILEYSAAHPTT
jgi:hypothetical protein